MKKIQKSKKDFVFNELTKMPQLLFEAKYVIKITDVERGCDLKFDQRVNDKLLTILYRDIQNVIITYE